MKDNSNDNKPFVTQMSLLYLCLFATAWIAKSHESVAVVLNYISKADMIEAAPLVIQMLNKWYFIGL